ncbi:MAG TPA: DUF3857 domain-containing protein [Terriglobales bacterium]|jgi:transglutaminase-like putative cysteine protease/tetratricopeptide (TPR) repeat protein
MFSVRPVSRALAAAFVICWISTVATAQTGVSTPAQRIAAQQSAFAAATTPLARLQALYRIEDLAPLATTAELDAVWTKLAATPGLDPLLSAEIQAQQVVTALRRGDATAAAALVARLGAVEHWQVLGPFDNSSPSAMATEEGPEKGPIDLKASYSGKQRKVSWRAVPFTAGLGEMNLGAYLNPSQSVAAYAITWVRSDTAQPVALRLRDDGATRLWVNGKLVYQETGTHSSHGWDQHAVGARLDAGWNQILAKVGVGETSDWRFSLRLTTPDGQPLALPSSDEPHAPAAAAAGGEAPAVRDLSALAQQAASAPTATANDKLAYAWLLAEKLNFNTGDHKDVNAFLDAQAAFPAGSAGQAGALVDFVEHDHDISRRYQYLQQLLQTQPRSPWAAEARLDRGMLELGRGAYQPARDDFWSALGGAGTSDSGETAGAAQIQKSPMAALGMFEVYAAVGLRPQALAWAAAIQQAGVALPAVSEAVGITLRRVGPLTLARQWMQAAQQQGAYDMTLALELADVEQRLGAPQPSLATLQKTVALNGELPNLMELEARALAGLGRRPEALARIHAAVGLAPDQPDLRVAAGEIERHFGEHQASVEAWQAALALNPQDSSLRDRLQLARGGEAAQEASFERPYTLDLNQTIAAYKARPEADRQKLESGPLVILANISVANIFPSGNTGRYVEQIFRINNDNGANSLGYYPVTYDPATEQVRFLSAHVVHPDGSSADAPEADDALLQQSVGYETFYNVRNKYVTMPSMRAGDFVEIAYRVLPTTLESLYGDYFGDLDTFGGAAPTLLQKYIVISPANKPLYSQTVRFHGGQTKTSHDGQTVYEWSASDLPPELQEPLAAPEIERVPYVSVSAFQTWEQFATWYRHLIRDTFVMDAEMKDTVARLVAGKTSEADKVDAIYRWVIQNTHYVALEFGIHGYRPYPVTQVFHRRFGDCKDKASLLIAMLHQAGIESEFVLVRIRDLGLVDPTVPSVADFDHAIVYVPGMKLYLDGTAEYNGTRELPAGDQRAFVLRIPVASDLAAAGTAQAVDARFNAPVALAPVVTPEKPATVNVVTRSLNGQLDADGNLRFSMDLVVTGDRAPQMRQALELPDRQTGALQAMLRDRLPGIEILSATVQNDNDWNQPLEVRMEGSIPRFASVNGATLLVPRQIVPRSWVPDLAALGSRTTDLLTGPPQIVIEEMHLALPAGYQAGALPAPTQLKQPFAAFQADAVLNGSTLTLRSRIETTQPLIAPDGYAAFRAFWAQVDAALGRSIAILKP